MSSQHASWDSDAFRSRTAQVLTDFINGQAQWLTHLGPDADRLLDHAHRSVIGGKMLRATFCWWGYRAVAEHSSNADHGASNGETDILDSLARAGAALELLHASALVHDDLMDASETRRGQPATHVAFAQLHQQQRWAGSSEQYGVSAAILLGDLLLSWADQMLRTCGLPSERVLSALAYLDQTRSEVILGQFLDMSAQVRPTRDVEAAMQVVRYKSAKYTIERPLHIGAALGGATPEQISALSKIGLPLGEAFQLRDDLLGVFGDPAVTGKPAGDDLTEGKRTVLIALALDCLDADKASRLDVALGHQLSTAEVAHLRELIEESGARGQVELVIEQLRDRALTSLQAAAISETAKAGLRELADQATRRSY